MRPNEGRRWLVAISATIVHLFLGTVYAWSFFQKPISEEFGWSQSATAWAFSIAIFMLGITAAYCGGKIQKFGVRKLAVGGTVLYAFGYIISYFALRYHLLPLLYFGFGIVGGIGLGMAYVTPVAVVSGWFPDKQGLVTGMVVMGFGLGAFIMSKLLAPAFLKMFSGDLASTFLAIGILLLILHPASAWFLKPSKSVTDTSDEVSNDELKRSTLTRDFGIIWLIFTFNIIAGMIFISFQSPLLQDLLKNEGLADTSKLEKSGATLIAVSALFNGFGRFLWGTLSDRIGRINAFRSLIFLEILTFLCLIFIQSSTVFFVGVCIILLCYGGGFGVIPSLIKERYGSRLMAGIYGITLIGWGVGGIIGPQVTAIMKDYYPATAGLNAFYVALSILIVGFILSTVLKVKKA